MSLLEIDYRMKTATADVIHAYLRACTSMFVPPLDERVDLAAFSEKIIARATTFEAWSEGNLVGLVAAYLNDPERYTSFITIVSVRSEYVRNGIARELIRRCIDHARRLGFDNIRLEVHPGNMRAISIYSNAGFVVFKRKGQALMMVLRLDRKKSPRYKENSSE